MTYAYNYLHSFTAVEKQVDVGEPSHVNIKLVLYHQEPPTKKVGYVCTHLR